MPSCITSSLSTFDSRLTLWVITTTVVPIRLRYAMAISKACSPSVSRLALGSSKTTSLGSPYRARARPIR